MTERTDNKGLDLNNGEKDVEEEGHNEGKLGHEFSGALPDMNEHGVGMDDSLTQNRRRVRFDGGQYSGISGDIENI